MPTNRKRTPRNRKDILPFDDTVKEFLLYGTTTDGTLGHELKCSRFFNDSHCNDISKTWRQYKKVLMVEWKKSGRAGECWGQIYERDSHQALHGNNPHLGVE